MPPLCEFKCNQNEARPQPSRVQIDHIGSGGKDRGVKWLGLGSVPVQKGDPSSSAGPQPVQSGAENDTYLTVPYLTSRTELTDRKMLVWAFKIIFELLAVNGFSKEKLSVYEVHEHISLSIIFVLYSETMV